jgi:hypothetical protein
MAHVKYTREMLLEAVQASTTMAGVLRFLGLPLNGGTHAHLRRRIDLFGIGTSHFVGSGHARGTVSPRRRQPDEILVLRPPDRKRQVPSTLRRALIESGRPYRCAACGIGDRWNGHLLTLHVDHVDGCFWDCRAGNLRFLCPNCHSQTGTFAGRNRARGSAPLVRVDQQGNAVEPVVAAEPAAAIEILDSVSRKEMTVADAARALGCSTSHVYALGRRLASRGSLASAARRPRIGPEQRTSIIAFAVAHPALGPRKIAPGFAVSAATVRNILKAAGLATRAERVAAHEATP